MIFDKKTWFSKRIIEIEDGMYRFAFSILKNDEDVQDAIQETILKAYKNLETLKNKNKFKSWIFTILKNTCFENLKKRNECLEITEEIASNTNDIDLKITLWDAVQNLAQPYRTTVTLFYYEDMSIKEISKITDTKEDAIKKQLSRGREKIKEVIEDENHSRHKNKKNC